jgi:hypothetical protein
MAEIHIEHELDCTEDTFWDRIVFNEAFNQRLYRDRLHFSVWEVRQHSDQGEQVQRKIDAVPPLGDLPLPLKKVVGESVGYSEVGTFDKSKRRYRMEVFPNKLGDKVTIRGELYTKPGPEGRCKRCFDASVKARLLGVGGMLEKAIASGIERSYDASARFTNKYIADQGLAP